MYTTTLLKFPHIINEKLWLHFQVHELSVIHSCQSCNACEDVFRDEQQTFGCCQSQQKCFVSKRFSRFLESGATNITF